MDTAGARHLVARIRARVKVGTTVVLEADRSDAGLVAGDRGVVNAITPDGVVIDWERGFSLSVDPETTPYRAIETV